jgi:hypothetical protein
MKTSDKFYYPGRLIYFEESGWTVKMWRGIDHKNAGRIVGKIPVKSIVDGLWGDCQSRRGVRVSLIKY